MAFDNNNNNNNNNENEKTPLVQAAAQPQLQPVQSVQYNLQPQQQQQQQQQQFYYPPLQQQQYVYQQQIPQHQSQTYVAAPPGYVYAPAPQYQIAPQYQPTPIIVEKCHTQKTHTSKDLTGAIIIFILGFFVSCVWLAGCLYFRSKEPVARGLGILSVVLFVIGVIVAIIILSVALAGSTSYSYYNYSSESSSYYYN
ncbi:hypothetical protein ACTFIU_009801 [Dictyostelium citrinum]